MIKRILLTFDVEEFDIPQEYGRDIEAQEQISVTVDGLQTVLELLDQLHITATFFTTAHFALSQPDLMKQVARKHEVASHGYYHSSFELKDLAKSRQVLEQVAGTRVVGFRRPRFAETDCAAIREAGYRYASSENPIWLPGRYNNLLKPRRVYRVGELLQIPVSASPYVRFPLFWLAFKNAPLPLVRFFSWHTLAHDGYLNLLFHPWEFADISGYNLPSYVARHGGRTMSMRVQSYLRWLAGEGQFCQCADFEREFPQGDRA